MKIKILTYGPNRVSSIIWASFHVGIDVTTLILLTYSLLYFSIP